MTTQATGIDRIAAERQRQIDQKGYDAAHDAQHRRGEISRAAAAYILGDGSYWPWEQDTFYPSAGDRVRNLEKAGALLAAEIDRLLALESDEDGQP